MTERPPLLLPDPASAHNHISIVEHDGLSGRDRPLRNVESREHFVSRSFDGRIRGFMTMADLRLHPHGLTKLGDGYPVQVAGTQRLRHKIVPATDHNLALGAVDLQNVKRIPGRNAKALALSHGEVVDALMLADDLTSRSHQLTRGIRQRLARLLEIGINELGVVSTRHKADLLRVRLLSDLQSEFARLRPDV